MFGLETWIRLDEIGKIEKLRSMSEIPINIIVFAAQDPSYLVRSEILSRFANLAEKDIQWLRLLKKMSIRDPNPDLRKLAQQMLLVLSGAC